MLDYGEVGTRIDAIEAEMKRLGWWQNEPLPEEAYNFRSAFAMDTMAFSQWLQYIFIPRVRGVIAERGDFPRQSQVGAQAVREFDGVWEASDLLRLLSEFDHYIENRGNN
jgi:uncharacterized protein YqcC (DUF446 family)